MAARRLIFPDRPDPTKSRHIAECRLVASCFIALAVFITIGVQILTPATATEATSVNPVPFAGAADRGQISIGAAVLIATNLPMTILHADPNEIMDVADAARLLAPLIKHHDEASPNQVAEERHPVCRT